MEDRHPTGLWLVRNRIAIEKKPNPIESLEFLLLPLKSLSESAKLHDSEWRSRRVTILEQRFKLNIKEATMVNWHFPFSTEFKLLSAAEVFFSGPILRQVVDERFPLSKCFYSDATILQLRQYASVFFTYFEFILHR